MALRRVKKLIATKRGKIDEADLVSKVQKKAYALYERRGYSHGNDWSDWFEAERHVRSELGIR